MTKPTTTDWMRWTLSAFLLFPLLVVFNAARGAAYGAWGILGQRELWGMVFAGPTGVALARRHAVRNTA